MSKKATEFQKREMSKMYRGKEIFKPLNTGWVDERVAWGGGRAGVGGEHLLLPQGRHHHHDRCRVQLRPAGRKNGLAGHRPAVHPAHPHHSSGHRPRGAVESDSPGLFRSAKLYIGEIENRYLTGEVRRKVIYHLYKLPQVTINNEKVLLHDGETFEIDGIKIECFLVPGHTWGHMSIY